MRDHLLDDAVVEIGVVVHTAGRIHDDAVAGDRLVHARPRLAAALVEVGDQDDGAVRVHPTNPDIVYVSATGDPFKPTPERGIYRTRDGGRSWQKVLFVSDSTVRTHLRNINAKLGASNRTQAVAIARRLGLIP